jgi:hypothetical protein
MDRSMEYMQVCKWKEIFGRQGVCGLRTMVISNLSSCREILYPEGLMDMNGFCEQDTQDRRRSRELQSISCKAPRKSHQQLVLNPTKGHQGKAFSLLPFSFSTAPPFSPVPACEINGQ